MSAAEAALINATIALVAATVVLVLVTGYYAWQTRNMVGEMREARKAGVRPKVVPAYEAYGAATGFPRIVNVGAGPALDVDVTYSYEPGGASRHRWQVPVLMPGEFREFTPRTLGADWADVQKVTATYSTLELHGACQVSLGDRHTIDESFDLREWWELVISANERVERGRKSPEVKALEGIKEALAKR